MVDAVLGRGESAITVPALDGALRPNRRLDEAAERIAIRQLAAIVAGPDGVLVGSADEIRRLEDGGGSTLVHKAESAIACLGLAAGGLAVGLENGAVQILGGRFGGTRFDPAPGMRCPVAISSAEDSLYVCHGSAAYGPAEW